MSKRISLSTPFSSCLYYRSYFLIKWHNHQAGCCTYLTHTTPTLALFEMLILNRKQHEQIKYNIADENDIYIYIYSNK